MAQDPIASLEKVKNISNIIQLIISSIGILGNILTFIVLTQTKLNHLSTTVFLTSLSFVEFCYMLLKFTLTSINTFVDDKSHETLFRGLCKIQYFLIYSISQFSVWLIVAVTIERTIWVMLPFKARQICTSRKNALIVCLLIFVCVSINLPYPFIVIFTPANVSQHLNKSYCSLKPKYSFVTITDMLITFLLPLIIIITCNYFIVTKLQKMDSIQRRHREQAIKSKLSNILKESNEQNEKKTDSKVWIRSSSFQPDNNQPRIQLVKFIDNQDNNTKQNAESSLQYFPIDPSNRRATSSSIAVSPSTSANCSNTQQHASSTCQKTRSKNRANSITRMMLITNVFFIIAATPVLIFTLLSTYKQSMMASNPLLYLKLSKFFHILWYMNFSIHFLLYCLSGEHFRIEAIKLFRLDRFACCRIENVHKFAYTGMTRNGGQEEDTTLVVN